MGNKYFIYKQPASDLMIQFLYPQWSYGVLCWEVFSVGKMPYPGLDPKGVVDLLDHGGRLYKPGNAGCSEEM